MKRLCMLLVCAFTLAASIGLRAQTLFTPVQLDNLLAPVALYPDPLLAQVLPASTYPDEIQSAEQWIQQGNNPRDVDDMDWDVSVKSVAHYPSVLSQLANQMDWTTSLGQAYVDQPDDVMDAVQRLRREARAEGNLVSNRDQQVLLQGGYIAIDPLQPQYIYVPQYNPQVVYVRRGNLLSFGVGLAIGAWLNYDFQWRSRRIYYTGWQGGGWVGRSRPDIQVNNTYYVNNQYRNVPIDRTVINRSVDYNRLNSVRGVHNNVNYADVATRRQQVAPRVTSQPPTIEARPAQSNPYTTRGAQPAPRGASPAATPAARAPRNAAPAPNRAARPQPARPEPARPPATRSNNYSAPARNAAPARPEPSRPNSGQPSARPAPSRTYPSQPTARPQPSRPAAGSAAPNPRNAPNNGATARPAPSQPAPSRAMRPAPEARPAPSRTAPARPEPSRPAPQQRTAPQQAAPSHAAPQRSASPGRGNKNNNNKPPDKPKQCCG